MEEVALVLEEGNTILLLSECFSFCPSDKIVVENVVLISSPANATEDER